MRDKRGFTLIELMIAVGIIAILATVAITGYNRFVVKTKRTEVLSNLDGIYKAESTYFGDANSYTDDFVQIRWKPEGKSLFTYTVGAQYFGILPHYAEPNPDGSPGGGPGALPAGATRFGFTAYAWGNFDSDPKMDVWRTNDMKDMVLQADDLAE